MADMAIYHQSVKPVQRSAGRSVIAAAAYRSGERIVDERSEDVHDYSRRGGIAHSEIVGWAGTRAELWNLADRSERRKDSTLAREYEISLPRELSAEQQKELALSYAKWLHEKHHVAVDVCIHAHDPENPHAHLMATTRVVGADGRSLGDKAAVEWSDTKRKQHGLDGRKSALEAARKAWENHANLALINAGRSERIDHRSLAAQREAALERGDTTLAEQLDREPQTKIGVAARQMDKRGKDSDRVQEQQERDERNAERQAQYAKLREVVLAMAERGVAEFTRRYERAKEMARLRLLAPKLEKQRDNQYDRGGGMEFGR